MNTWMILGGKTTPIFGLTPKSGHLGFLKIVTEPQEDLCAKAIALQVWSWGRDARRCGRLVVELTYTYPP